jgi:hypothetical protein
VFPGHHPGPRKWLSLTQGFIDTALGYLTEAAIDGLADDAASDLVKDAEQLGGNAYLLLQHMAGSDAEHIPHQIVGPFQRWVDSLGIQKSVFFRADHTANYELFPVDLTKFISRINKPSQSLLDAAAAIEWPMLRVTVPSQALGMLPHFAVVAHELGHALQDEILVNMTTHVGAEQDSLNQTKARLATVGLTYGPSEHLERQTIAARWLNELKSDAVGHLLVGPAFYFALFGFIELADHGYGISPTHPPSVLRRRILLEQLQIGGPSFFDVFKEHTGVELSDTTNSPHLVSLPDEDTLFGELASIMGPRSAAICVGLIPLMSALAPEVILGAEQKIRSVADAIIYTPVELARDLECHLAELVQLIPPIERRDRDSVTASSITAILNVGWAALLSCLEKIPVPTGAQGDPAARKMERLHSLLLKAVELSEARQLWDECR